MKRLAGYGVNLTTQDCVNTFSLCIFTVCISALCISFSSVGKYLFLCFSFCFTLRIKEYCLPPIPKPRIIGIDPLLLKVAHKLFLRFLEPNTLCHSSHVLTTWAESLSLSIVICDVMNCLTNYFTAAGDFQLYFFYICFPLLLFHLQMGNLEEINRHFSNFHSYKPPSYSEEVWDRVSTDDARVLTSRACGLLADTTDREKDVLLGPCDLSLMTAHHPIAAQNPSLYVQSLPPYCSLPPEAFDRPLDVPALWPRPEIMSSENSVMGNCSVPNSSPEASALTIKCSPQDFYTCVQLMNETGEVHLVPCLPPAYCSEFPGFPIGESDSNEQVKEKKKQLAEHQATTKLINGTKDGRKIEPSEAAVPLLQVTGESQAAQSNSERHWMPWKLETVVMLNTGSFCNLQVFLIVKHLGDFTA